MANCTSASEGHQYLTYDMSMFQGSSRFEISGGTFNAVAGDQITYNYSGEPVHQMAAIIEQGFNYHPTSF
jgi:hypothetical protein